MELADLVKKRGYLKAGITRNKTKAKSIIEGFGSRTVVSNAKQRIMEHFAKIIEINKHISDLSKGENEGVKVIEYEEEVRVNVEEIIDEIDAYLESRADDPESSMSFAPGMLNEKSLQSEDSSLSDSHNSDIISESDYESHSSFIDAKVAVMKVKHEKELLSIENQLKAQEARLSEERARLKLKREEKEASRMKYKAKLLGHDVELSDKHCNKTIKKQDRGVFSVDSKREIKGMLTDHNGIKRPQWDNDLLDSQDDEIERNNENCAGWNLDSLFKGLKKPELSKFAGDKGLYHDWRAQFDVFVDQSSAPAKVKMLMLKSALTGKPLKVIERLGFTPKQYQTALEKLDQKYGGEKRLLQHQLDSIMHNPEIGEGDLKQLEIFSDRLTDIAAKLSDHGYQRELAGISALYTAVQSKVPETLLVLYQQWVYDNDKVDGLSMFAEWLARQVVYRNDAEEVRKKKREKTEKTVKKSCFQSSRPTAVKSCPVCPGDHSITDCKKWAEARVKERWKIAKEKQLCYRCLRPNHRGSECRSSNRCSVEGCTSTHHYHLHFEKAEEPKEETRSNSNTSFGATAGRTSTVPGSVLLRTVPVWVSANGGQRIKVNAFLDDGSDTSYIRNDVATALGVQAREGKLTLSTLTNSNVQITSKEVSLEIASLEGDTKRRLNLWTLDELCAGMPIPDWNRYQHHWDHLKGLGFHRLPGRKTVDILIGSDHPELTLALEERAGEPGEPVARRTPLGWTCVGRVPDPRYRRTAAHTRTVTSTKQADAYRDEEIRQMWDADTLGETNTDVELTPDEKTAIRKAEETFKYVSDRYEIGIPWKEEVPDLPNNKDLAESRLKSLERSLHKRPEVAQKYREVMNANIEKGYIRKLSPDEASKEPGYYLPHFPVIREDKETTKVRIVLDSKVTHKGTSLNDAMLTGPKLQRDILETLLRFRLKPVALVGDIKEMFSQVALAEKDRCYHRLLWRDLDTSKEAGVYEAVRLVFGDRSSPFLAQYVMRRHAEELKDEYKLASQVVLERMYMDDVLDSANTVREALDTREELIALLGRAGFTIRRWCSNKPEVLQGIPDGDRASGLKLNESELPSLKTLGVMWDSNRDVFLFTHESETNPMEMTKRGLLSRLATLFDPLQMAAPFTIRAKMALQAAWLEGLGWDDELPETLRKTVEKWTEELDRLDGIHIPRCYRSRSTYSKVSLHTLTDASKSAYAAVTYARYEYEDESVEVNFVAAKAKVAPIKAVAIPRLELMAACTGLKLAETSSRILGIPLNEHTFWTDSMDVIHWIRGQSRKYKPFVAHRVSEIQEKTSPHQWRHVPGVDNSADDATRGLSITDLDAESRWFRGPAFLHEGELTSSSAEQQGLVELSQEAEAETIKVKTTYHVRKAEQILDPNKFSSWTKLVRVTAWIFRFINRARKDKGKATEHEDYLTVNEIAEGEKYWIKFTQRQKFADELKSLQKSSCEKNKGKLRQLSPFVDEEGIMRVGGRLDGSSLPYESKHPVILPKNDRVSYLIVSHVHQTAGHSFGTNYVLSELRQKYWVIHSRELIKRIKRECNWCKIRAKRIGNQVMAPLPKARLGESLRCFSHCCVDFAGPFTTKLTRRVTAKRYLCLFTCAATRAVHLELAFSLDTDSFLDAFSRMTARRGRPEMMISDNGTNFVAADKELRALVTAMDTKKIADEGANVGIEWKFNPPTGSHHGGVFESLIKTAKRSIRAILGNAGITDEELLTAIVEVEGLMNSRPLTYCGDDPDDDPVLTPNHFLHGQAGGQLAPRVTDEVAFNPRNRWRFVQDLVHKIWRRWMKEYLSTLNTRNKWTALKDDVRLGDIVLMVDQNNPRGRWPLARVTKLYPGSDGHVRVVDVLASGKTYRRPITKLCLLKLN